MPRLERSAGIILFHQSDAGVRRYLLLDYGRHWDYPKGHVEKGEQDHAAAIRELSEETGINEVALVGGFVHELTYFFKSKKKRLVHKTVVFFLGKSHKTEVELSDEHVGYEWLPYDRAIEQVSFETAKEALRKAEQFLSQKGV